MVRSDQPRRLQGIEQIPPLPNQDLEPPFLEPKKSSTRPSLAISSPRPGTRGDEIPAMPGPVNPLAGAIGGH